MSWIKVQLESGKTIALTGFFVGSDTVVTNAHGVYYSNSKEWAKKIVVYPGQNGNTSPFGHAVATVASIHPNYLTENGVNQSYDLAVLKLNKKLGDEVGALPLSTGISENLRIRALGYPGDKGENGQYSQYESYGNIFNLGSEQFRHDADTYSGSSGSPLLNSEGQVVGLNF